MPSFALKTKHAPWVRYKTVVASDTILTTTTMKGANVPPTAYIIPESMNNLEFRAQAADNVNMECTAYFYGARWKDKSERTFDDISLIGSAVLTSGAQRSTDNGYYIDTVVLTDKWITEVKVADGNAGDGMSRIAFDASGYDGFFVLLDYTDATDWILDVSGW